MKFRRMKPVLNFVFVACTVLVIWCVTINPRMLNCYSVINGIYLDRLSKNHEYDRNSSSENGTDGFTSKTYLNYTEQRRQLARIQMSMEQMAAISEALSNKGNLLVWGLGTDSLYWHNSTTGKVVFIEDEIPLRNADILWDDAIVKKYPFLEVYRVYYTTRTVKSFNKYINNSEIWSELDLRGHLPVSVIQTHWHVIVVNAPLDCCQTGPGRYQSIYTSNVLASEGTHVFVDDFERTVEHEFALKVFGKPVEIIKTRSTNESSANEQAHFILSSVKQ